MSHWGLGALLKLTSAESDKGHKCGCKIPRKDAHQDDRHDDEGEGQLGVDSRHVLAEAIRGDFDVGTREEGHWGIHDGMEKPGVENLGARSHHDDQEEICSPCDAQDGKTSELCEETEAVVIGGLAGSFCSVCPEAEYECRHPITSRVQNGEDSEQYGVPYRDGAKVIRICGKLAEDSSGRFRVVAVLFSILFISAPRNSLVAMLHRCVSCVLRVNRAVLLDCQPMRIICIGSKLGE